GTGGDENDLLPLAQALNSSFNVLSVRGEVSENAMNRFFKRYGEGQYDVEDLKYRTNNLIQFLKEAAATYHFDLAKAVAVGFSNISISMMLHLDISFNKVLLYVPLYHLDSINDKDLSNTKVLLSMGENDPIVSIQDSQNVIDIFKQRGATVKELWVNSHELT